MNGEENDRLKQLATYADAVTAFATAQLVGFVLLMAHGDCFTKNILYGLEYTIPIGIVVNLFYLSLIVLCHRAMGITSHHDRTIRTIRCGILVLDLVVTILIPVGINYGWHHNHFVIDCKGTSWSSSL